MSITQNKYKEHYIGKHGVTAGLPLFDGKCVMLPDWVWNGDDLKAEIYYKMKAKFQEDSFYYLRVLIVQFGGTATDHEVKQFFNDPDKWPLHIVSARRNYFKKSGIINHYAKKVPGPLGQPNYKWYVDFKKLYKILNNQSEVI